MPWNPAWKFSPVAYVVLVDCTTGHSWEIWGLPGFRNDTIYSGVTKIVQRGIHNHSTDEPASIFEKENGFQSSGAVGLARFFMFVTRAKIENGYIPHTLAYNIRATRKE